MHLGGRRMSYKIILQGETFVLKTKDEVISKLMQFISASNEINIEVVWPDGGFIIYDGWDE
jgi:hypothetical protein